MPLVDNSKLTIIDGLFCCTDGFYWDIPECIGCATEGECLCLQQAACLKLGGEGLTLGLKTGGDSICKIGLYCCEYGLKKPRTCCMARDQVCCISQQGALPPVPEIPCALALLCVVCYPKFGVCVKMSELGSGGPISQVCPVCNGWHTQL